MRRNLFLSTLFLFAALPALTAPALFTNPQDSKTRENVTCTAGTLTGDYGSLYSRQAIYNVSHFRKSNAAGSLPLAPPGKPQNRTFLGVLS